MAKIKLSEWAKENDISKEAVGLLRNTIDRKWIRILNGTGVDDGAMNCFLCLRFRRQGRGCDGCPISKETGKRWCDKTPYANWDSHHDKEHRKRKILRFPRKVECPECKEIAQKEVDLLEALYKRCIK